MADPSATTVIEVTGLGRGQAVGLGHATGRGRALAQKEGQKGLFLVMPPFPGAGVSQSAKHVEQPLVFLEFVEWS